MVLRQFNQWMKQFSQFYQFLKHFAWLVYRHSLWELFEKAVLKYPATYFLYCAYKLLSLNSTRPLETRELNFNQWDQFVMYGLVQVNMNSIWPIYMFPIIQNSLILLLYYKLLPGIWHILACVDVYDKEWPQNLLTSYFIWMH